MKKLIKTTLCFLFSAVMIISSASVAFASKTDCGGSDGCPTVIIPGLFQSELHLYNDDGSLALDPNGKEYAAPFFLEPTNAILKKVMKNVFFPLLYTLCTGDDPADKFANAFADTVGDVLMEKVKSDENGNMVYNVRALEYNCNFSECSEHDKEHILDCIPLSGYIEKAGGDHLYFFSYNSFGNIDEITAKLYKLIQQVKAETGHDKINIVPISQGGTLANNLLEYYPEVVGDLNRIIYVVPAIDGTSVVSDIYKNGINDDDDALYGYIIPTLIKDELTANIVQILLSSLPKSVLNKTLDLTVEKLVNNYLKNSTCLWAFITSDDYEYCRNKYLFGDKNAEIRRQADRYHTAQVNAKANVLKAMDKGVEVFDIVNYNYPLYCIADSWDDINADGVIHLDSTSFGSHSCAIGETLPEGYSQHGNDYGTCKDPENHNHIDSYNIVDASAGLLPDHTFYYYSGNHERTASNDALVALVTELLTNDDFRDVYSYPDAFPQFNNSRTTTDIRNRLADIKTWGTSALSPEDKAELEAAAAEAETMLSHTNVDIEETQRAEKRLNAIYDKILGNVPEKDNVFKSLLTKITGKIADSLNNKRINEN